jgi:hypothetical protein
MGRATPQSVIQKGRGLGGKLGVGRRFSVQESRRPRFHFFGFNLRLMTASFRLSKTLSVLVPLVAP